ncbi:PREDICTED: uncharacterized protein LOC105315447 [Amphimedon queenslandica]|uniref:Fibronectin type-III domain-containing protein n=1 Tax=Amphimedon queenslandica TaxID=400682 RepID=A0AAN0JY23_AMPQE|nr:PREDICTED: uncharacterized protein LOC105315447 [Amphimedon queenslandica]|eukprot:XP_019861824.1 PREDICTED: uncharacterized protein LOC105315447 [Amphimedon queenslandica]
MGMIVSFLSFMLLFNYLDGTPRFTTCPSSVCLSQPVTYECNSGSNILVWRVLDTNGVSVGGVSYTEIGNSVGDTGSIGGQFNTVLTVDGSSLVSNITFTPTLSMNNYTVQCGAASGIFANCSIVTADIPSAPIPGNIKFYSDRLNFSWSPSTSPCLSHYNVNVTSIEYTINTTDTSLSLPVPSTNDTQYSISVVAVDTGGRYMNPVGEETFVADVPEFVTDLTLSQTGLTIDVSWNEPATPMYPPVLYYTLHHNVLDSHTNITASAPGPARLTYSVPNATVGIAAVNILGVGPTVSGIISIHASTLITTVTHTTTLIRTDVAISSTRITSPTPTSTCTPSACTEQSSDTVSALAISFPITVILSVIISSVLSSIITYCCCVSRSVKSYSVTNPSTAAADYEIPMKTSSLEMKDNMAYGHVSVGNRSTSGITPTVYETVQS